MIFSMLAVVLFAVLGLGWYKAGKLRKIQIVKKILINAPMEEVFNKVKFLAQFPEWSPFLAQDPTQHYSIKGVDGQPGAQYHWEGNKGKDQGYQEIVFIQDNEALGMRCDIQKPFKAQPTFNYHFATTLDGVEVKQVFALESSRVDAFFMWLFGVRSQMEATNEQGLVLLKKAVENSNVSH